MTTPYLKTVQETYAKGLLYPDRTGKGRIRSFGAFERYDLSNNTLPADTTTQLYLKTLIKEVFAFIKGENRIEHLGEAFWRRWSPTNEDIEAFIDKTVETNPQLKELVKDPQQRQGLVNHFAQYKDTIGPMYGVLWRNFPRVTRGHLHWVEGIEDVPSDKIEAYKQAFALAIAQTQSPEKNTKEDFEMYALGQFSQTYDQLAMVMKQLRVNPYSSRHRVTAYHPDLGGSELVSPVENVLMGHGALTPCHVFFQFMVTDDPKDRTVKKLNCMMYMSSSDVMIGRPYNICQYSLLTIMMAHCLGYQPGEFILTSCDTHIYDHHQESVPEQLTRKPYPYPTVEIPFDKKDFFALTPEDITIKDYTHHPKIKYEVAV